MKRAQRDIEAAIASGSPSTTRRAPRICAAVRRYFEGFDGEARTHLRDVDRRLEHVNQVHFNLTAERGVAVKRIEATQGVLEALLARGSSAVKFLDRFGRATTDFFEYAGGLTLLSAESLGFMARLRIRVAETISQCALLGVQSLDHRDAHVALHRHGDLARIGTASRRVRLRQPRRRRGRLRLRARARADADGGRRRRPRRRRDRRRARLDGRHRADRGAALDGARARRAFWSCRGSSRCS